MTTCSKVYVGVRNLLGLLRSSGGQAVVSSGVVLLLTVLTGILTARMLQVEQRGTTAAVLALGAMLAQATNAGPAEGQLLAPRRGHPLGVTVRVAWLFSSVAVVVSAIPAIVYLHSITESNALLTAIVATTPAVAAVGLLCNYLLLGDKRFGASAILRMLPVFVQAIFLVGIWAYDVASVLSVIISSWFAGLLAGLFGLLFAKPWSRVGGSIQIHGLAVLRLMVTVGGAHAIRIIGYRLDLILLGLIAGRHDVGMYSVAVSLASAGISLTANLTPLVTIRSIGEDGSKFTQASSFLAALIATGIAVFGPILIPVIYGERYAPSQALLCTLAAAMYGAFLFDAASRIFQRAGHERVSFRTSIAVMTVQVAAISIGARVLGGEGAALGSFTAYFFGLATLAVLSRQTPGIGNLGNQLSPLMGVHVLIASLLKPQSIMTKQ